MTAGLLLAQASTPRGGPTPADDWIPLFPPAASSQAGEVDLVFFGLLIITGAVFALLLALLGWNCVRYRAGSSADRRGQIQRSWPYEATWISAITVVFLGIFIWSAPKYFDLQRAPADALRIHVVGKQWMWKVQHEGGQRELNELHVPVGRAVELVLTSQDVIHSLYIPAFRVKQDALPDRYTRLWFRATQVGEFELVCAEFCGTDHSVMRGRVVVSSPAAFEAWLGPGSLEPPPPGAPGTPRGPLALRGEARFWQLGCSACHLPTSDLRAPRLDGIWGRPVALRNGHEVVVDEDYVRESILEPNAKLVAGYPQPSLMPTYRGQVTEEDLAALVEFVRSLRDGWPRDEERGHEERRR